MFRTLTTMFLFLTPLFCFSEVKFIKDYHVLKEFQYSPSIMVASTGRSGSTLLTFTLDKYYSNHLVLKSHILPPKEYNGKILFIFSNPDKAAESALHLAINYASWGKEHFYHMKSSDMDWLAKIQDTTRQTLLHNLLSYDALGCALHLSSWFSCEKCEREEGQILAIKYENLWDTDTIEEIRKFLDLPNFSLPQKVDRGCGVEELNQREITFRNFYNLGTEDQPHYQAYDEARLLWEKSPSIQYFKLKS